MARTRRLVKGVFRSKPKQRRVRVEDFLVGLEMQLLQEFDIEIGKLLFIEINF